MITPNLREVIELVDERDPLNELFGMKSKHEKLVGPEKEYYDLYRAADEVNFRDGWDTGELRKIRRLINQMSQLKKKHPGIHNKVFSPTDKLIRKWNKMRASAKAAKTEAKEVKTQARSDAEWEDYAGDEG